MNEDLSRFRVHTDAEAVGRSGANAINLGDHLFFRPGAYDPNTARGRSLLGHELAHGLQSRGGADTAGAGAQRDVATESEADRVGEALVHDDGPVQVANTDRLPPALRGDKQISFSGSTITVTDTYVIHGPGASAEFLARFQDALDQYYNNPAFNYRGYTVNFNLRVRMKQTVTRTVGFFDWESEDWASDSDTSMFYVDTGEGRAGGISEITLYETSTVGTIAHEVGHYLSDRIGYFSEGYSEGIGSRLGITERHTTVDPGAEGDVMARSQTGTVGEFSLSGILDSAINSHEAIDYDWSGEQSYGFEYWDYCWVARVVVPDEWRWVRRYLLSDAPGWLREGYRRFGPRIAQCISDKPIAIAMLRPLCRMLAAKGRVVGSTRGIGAAHDRR